MKKSTKATKCNFSNRARSFAEMEVGCPLDHCECGTHDVDNEHHVCPGEVERCEDIEAAERAAGWDPNP
jgi:hypothetical protein